jgi:hypothetical protein
LLETRAFASWLASARGGLPAEALCTVTSFTVEASLVLPALVLAAVEANIWLGGRGRAEAGPGAPVTLRYSASLADPDALIDEAARLHSSRADVLHMTIAIPSDGPLLVLLTVDNLACDAASLALLVERISERCVELERGNREAAAAAAAVPSFDSMIPATVRDERVEAQRLGLEGAAWLEARHLAALPGGPFGDPVETEQGHDLLTTILSPAERERFADRRKRLGATPLMIGLAAWSALLGRLSGSGKVAALINSTARQVEGCDSQLGFFYDLAVLPMTVEPDIEGRSMVALARRAVIDHHLNYVPSGVLCEAIPAYREALADRSRPLLVLQSKNEAQAGGVFAGGRRSPLDMRMSNGAAFSVPLDGLITLATGEEKLAVTLEYRRASMPATAAQALLAAYKERLCALIADPEAPVAWSGMR